MAEPSNEKQREIFPESPYKTYGLMGLVRGRSPIVEKAPEDTVPTWPYLLIRELAATIIIVVILLVISSAFNAPLEGHASAFETPNPAKAPWYFLGLQELVHYSALFGGIIIPGVMVFLLMALPYLDRTPDRAPSKRKFLTILFTAFIVANIVLIIVGTYFRGPGWSFVLPWREGAVY